MSVVAIYLVFSMLLVLWFDVRRYIIPNWLVASMLIAYPMAVFMARNPVDWKMALLAMACVLVAGYIIFARKWMGGGDIKLMTACALWIGWSQDLLNFLFVVAVIGGAFSVVVWCIRKAILYAPREKVPPLPRILRDGEPVPYGVAIATAFLLALYNGNIPAIA